MHGQINQRFLTSRITLATLISSTLVATTLTTQPAIAQYYVRAATRVQTSGFGICDPQFHDDDTGQIQSSSIVSGPYTATSSGSDSCGAATCTAFSWAELGALHGYANYSASTPGAPAAGNGQSLITSWSDTITLVSDALPMGTPVTVQGTMTFHRSMSGTPGNNTLIQTYATYAPFNLGISDSFAFPDSTQTVMGSSTQYIGFPFTITGNVNFQAAGTAFIEQPDVGSISIPSIVFTLICQTPGASYTTASGVSYVPLLDADLNASGYGDGRDIALFVTAILTGSSAASDLYHADFDGDGVIGLGDIPGFTQKLLGP